MRMSKTAAAVALMGALVLAGTPAAMAQTMSMTHAAPPAGQPTPEALAAAATVPSTKAFIETAAAANQFEIVSSQVALQNTQTRKVRVFARKMIADHTKIGKGFVAALGEAKTGITPPAGMGADLDAIVARLKSEKGAAFNADYIAAQTKGHQDAVGLFAGYAKGGDNPVLQAFAKKTLPIIQMHLEMCYALAKAKG